MDLLEKLTSAYRAARDATRTEKSDKAGNRARSAAWVEHLAYEFRAVYPADRQHAIFSQGCTANKKEYGVNELLFDILVCKTSTVVSPVHRVKLSCVTSALWAVESEFSNNTRSTIFDFSKLAIAKATFKLMVIAPSKYTMEALLCCADAVSADSALFVACVPHPAHWDDDESNLPTLWTLSPTNVWVSSRGPDLALQPAASPSDASAVERSC